jgi:hypothetical protein
MLEKDIDYRGDIPDIKIEERKFEFQVQFRDVVQGTATI